MTNVRTQNPEYGFYGTLAPTGMQDELWDIAINAISEDIGECHSYIRPFLDSASGRHFADDVYNYMDGSRTPAQAVNMAITRWMSADYRYAPRNWRIRVPMLVGLVHREAIYEDAEAEEYLGA